MRRIVILMILMSCLFSNSVVAQENKSEAKVDYVGFLTLDEFSNLHIWIDNKVKDMKLNTNELTEYTTLFGYYTGKFSTIGDKKNEFKTKASFLENMSLQIENLNTKVEDILSEDQKTIHAEIMTTLKRRIKNKLDQLTID